MLPILYSHPPQHNSFSSSSGEVEFIMYRIIYYALFCLMSYILKRYTGLLQVQGSFDIAQENTFCLYTRVSTQIMEKSVP